jgi:hypothetical protein
MSAKCGGFDSYSWALVAVLLIAAQIEAAHSSSRHDDWFLCVNNATGACGQPHSSSAQQQQQQQQQQQH